MIRLGVVGYGGRISSLMEIFYEIAPDSKIVAIVDPDEKGARSRLRDVDKDAIFYKDMATMVKEAKLDGMMIGTRCHMHAELAIEAAKYNIPLFLEKPVAINMEQAQALEAAYKNIKTPVVVSFPLRVAPVTQLARRYINEGKIGTPQHICVTNYVPYGTVYWEQEYRNYKITQGLFLQKATHDFDYMMLLMGAPITRVAAIATTGKIFGGNKPAGLRCSQCNEVRTCRESPWNRTRGRYDGCKEDHPCLFSKDCGNPSDGMNEDSSSALLEFANGTHGIYTQVFFSRRDAAQRGARVSGYEGTLDFDFYRDNMFYYRHFEPFSDTIGTAASGLDHFSGDHELAIDFFNAVRGHGDVRVNMNMGIQSSYVCLAAKESLETGSFADVRQVADYQYDCR